MDIYPLAKVLSSTTTNWTHICCCCVPKATPNRNNTRRVAQFWYHKWARWMMGFESWFRFILAHFGERRGCIWTCSHVHREIALNMRTTLYALQRHSSQHAIWAHWPERFWCKGYRFLHAFWPWTHIRCNEKWWSAWMDCKAIELSNRVHSIARAKHSLCRMASSQIIWHEHT